MLFCVKGAVARVKRRIQLVGMSRPALARVALVSWHRHVAQCAEPMFYTIALGSLSYEGARRVAAT
jgi:hypothetical protein